MQLDRVFQFMLIFFFNFILGAWCESSCRGFTSDRSLLLFYFENLRLSFNFYIDYLDPGFDVLAILGFCFMNSVLQEVSDGMNFLGVFAWVDDLRLCSSYNIWFFKTDVFDKSMSFYNSILSGF